jgi:hypothetical protein
MKGTINLDDLQNYDREKLNKKRMVKQEAKAMSLAQSSTISDKPQEMKQKNSLLQVPWLQMDQDPTGMGRNESIFG